MTARLAPAYSSALSARDLSPLNRPVTLLRSYAAGVLVLVASYLIATYWRKSLPFGRWVGSNYQWHSPELYLTIAAATALAYAAYPVLPGSWLRRASPQLYVMLGAIALSTLGITVFLPHQSGLQKLYFAVVALLLTLLLVPWGGARGYSVRGALERLWANRSLLRIWVQYNVQSRYAQALLGVIWIILLPLSTALVMTVVFSQIMRVPVGNVPFAVFFLSGFVPWGLFSQAVSGSMRSVLGAMGLMNQIYFPREILVLSALGEALADAVFMYVALFVITFALGIHPNWYYLLIPVLLVIQIGFTVGLMFIVSWVSVFVRDVPQLVSVLLQIWFYLCPIIYPLQIVPHRYRFLITLNPLAVIIQAYRDIILYARMPDWSSLLYPAAFGLALLIYGYRHFKVNEDRFADMM